MSRKLLAENLRTATGMTLTQARVAVDQVIDDMAEALAAGELRISGLGNFSAKIVQGGPGRNPRTGEAITFKDFPRFSFRAAQTLRDAANQALPKPAPRAAPKLTTAQNSRRAATSRRASVASDTASVR